MSNQGNRDQEGNLGQPGQDSENPAGTTGRKGNTGTENWQQKPTESARAPAASPRRRRGLGLGNRTRCDKRDVPRCACAWRAPPRRTAPRACVRFSFVAQRDHRVHPRRAMRRDEARAPIATIVSSTAEMASTAGSHAFNSNRIEPAL